MKKQLPAFVAALAITGFIALAMVVTSANALINTNGTANSNDPAIVSSSTNASQVQIDQLQARINEYQQREAQYQQLLQQDQEQIQQFRQFLFAMQQAGLIQIRNDGTIVITGRGRGGDD